MTAVRICLGVTGDNLLVHVHGGKQSQAHVTVNSLPQVLSRMFGFVQTVNA